MIRLRATAGIIARFPAMSSLSMSPHGCGCGRAPVLAPNPHVAVSQRRHLITEVMSYLVYSPPVDAVSALYGWLHYTVGLSWPLTIASVAVMLRTAGFPCDVIAKKAMRNRHRLRPILLETKIQLERDLKLGKLTSREHLNSVYAKVKRDAWLKFKCRPSVDGSAQTLNLLGFVLGSVALYKPIYARIYFDDVSNFNFPDLMTDQSIPWVLDLSSSDPYFILPGIFILSLLARFRLGKLEEKLLMYNIPPNTKTGSEVTRTLFTAVQIALMTLFAGLSLQMPVCMLLFWTVNGYAHVGKALLLETKGAKTLLNIPRFEKEFNVAKEFFTIRHPRTWFKNLP